MSFLRKIAFIAIISSPSVFGMGGAPGMPGGPSLAGIYQDVKDVQGQVNANSGDANMLRAKLAALTGRIGSLCAVSPNTLGSMTRAQEVSGTLDGAVNLLLGTGVGSSVQTAEAVKGGISASPYLQALFINQGNNASVWDTHIYPQVLTAFIRLQASYVSAILNYISQNIGRLKPEEISALNHALDIVSKQLGF